MDFSIRPAQVADTPHLACAFMEASGGLAQAVYGGAIPGRSTQVIVEHMFTRPNAPTAFTNCWVAENEERVLGSIHAFPMDDMGAEPADPLVPEDRKYLFEPFEHMHADGSCYIMAVAVYAEFRGCGIGTRLIAEAQTGAKAGGFSQMSLNVFAENGDAVRLYETLEYKERVRRPVVGHESIRYGGDYLLMTRDL